LIAMLCPFKIIFSFCSHIWQVMELPGYNKNSQYRVMHRLRGEINITPDIFSPDNDRMNDLQL